MFPTLVQLVSGFLSKEQCDEIIAYARTLGDQTHGCIPENGISNHDISYSFLQGVSDNVLSCKVINRQLTETLNAYGREVGYPNMAPSNSWINFQYKESQLTRHTHPDSIVSAALYLKMDDDSSKIFFYNPNPYIVFSDYRERTPYSFEYQWLLPKTGDLVLFPSWLGHGSNGEKNQSDERVVISFNTSKV